MVDLHLQLGKTGCLRAIAVVCFRTHLAHVSKTGSGKHGLPAGGLFSNTGARGDRFVGCTINKKIV
jgi:hypothetical protein